MNELLVTHVYTHVALENTRFEKNEITDFQVFSLYGSAAFGQLRCRSRCFNSDHVAKGNMDESGAINTLAAHSTDFIGGTVPVFKVPVQRFVER